MAAKRVESFRVPCLDAGSTPATSTITKRICFIYKWVCFVVVLFVVLFGFLHEKWMPAQHFCILLRRHFYVF